MKREQWHKDFHVNAVPQLEDVPRDYFYNLDYNYLTLQEVQLLLTLTDSQTAYSFSGLRKSTSLHQYKLTKAIKRLVDRDLIIKNEIKTYELTEEGSNFTRKLLHDLLQKEVINISDIYFHSQRKKLKLIPSLDQNTIISNFEKRWFLKYRFVYRKVENQDIVLCWEDNEKNQVHMSVDSKGNISVEFRSLKPNNSELNIVLSWINKELTEQYGVNTITNTEQNKEDYNSVLYN